MEGLRNEMFSISSSDTGWTRTGAVIDRLYHDIAYHYRYLLRKNQRLRITVRGVWRSTEGVMEKDCREWGRPDPMPAGQSAVQSTISVYKDSNQFFRVYFRGGGSEKWEKVVPLVKEIDAQYQMLCPKEHQDQLKAARSTPFHIRGTAFSTVTTNLNFRTAAHMDNGDWPTGFGNLVVIERGAPYKGAYTGFPQYGVAVDCRTGDFLAMDVHQVHGNSPMVPTDDTSQRLSLVNYLREGIIKKCGNQKMYDAEALEKRLEKWRAKTRKHKK